MTPEEFDQYYPRLWVWIQQTLVAHSENARTVASLGFQQLALYFSAECLHGAKFIIVDRVPTPPLSAMGLTQFAGFEDGDWDGITYLDTFFVKAKSAADESLYLHEMVHV